MNQTQANAMAYFLLGDGRTLERCSTCDAQNSRGPFGPCFVPSF